MPTQQWNVTENDDAVDHNAPVENERLLLRSKYKLTRYAKSTKYLSIS
jgi:hypothetical protein